MLHAMATMALSPTGAPESSPRTVSTTGEKGCYSANWRRPSGIAGVRTNPLPRKTSRNRIIGVMLAVDAPGGQAQGHGQPERGDGEEGEDGRGRDHSTGYPRSGTRVRRPPDQDAERGGCLDETARGGRLLEHSLKLEVYRWALPQPRPGSAYARRVGGDPPAARRRRHRHAEGSRLRRGQCPGHRLPGRCQPEPTPTTSIRSRGSCSPHWMRSLTRGGDRYGVAVESVDSPAGLVEVAASVFREDLHAGTSPCSWP